MRFRVLLVALLCTTTSCGGSAEPPHHLSVVRQVDEKERQLAVTASALEQRAEFYERLNFVAWTTAAARANAARERAERQPRQRALALPFCPAEIVALVTQTFPDDAEWALRTVYRESRCQPAAYNGRESCGNGSHAAGLMQLCWPMHAALAASVGCSDPFDPVCNLRTGRKLYDGSGRRPWGGG